MFFEPSVGDVRYFSFQRLHKAENTFLPRQRLPCAYNHGATRRRGDRCKQERCERLSFACGDDREHARCQRLTSLDILKTDIEQGGWRE